MSIKTIQVTLTLLLTHIILTPSLKVAVILPNWKITKLKLEEVDFLAKHTQSTYGRAELECRLSAPFYHIAIIFQICNRILKSRECCSAIIIIFPHRLNNYIQGHKVKSHQGPSHVEPRDLQSTMERGSWCTIPPPSCHENRGSVSLGIPIFWQSECVYM